MRKSLRGVSITHASSAARSASKCGCAPRAVARRRPIAAPPIVMS